MIGRRTGLVMAAVAALAAGVPLAGCSRDEAPMSPCNGADPAYPRVSDAGPPNCTTLLPGAPEASPAPPLGAAPAG
ncbi:MAG: hypothetical protein N2422_08425 [Rhodobacteraceae bacterium]|nr:hypothetical protein [Paracoccaceae bacterium]